MRSVKSQFPVENMLFGPNIDGNASQIAAKGDVRYAKPEINRLNMQSPRGIVGDSYKRGVHSGEDEAIRTAVHTVRALGGELERPLK